ncbi:MAG: acetylxylan esterase [Propionibacteriales bacterium]|nr:acetylxylan esterase [Propionibacteriales bacterium]
MPLFDLPADKLAEYRPDLPVPEDLERFWRETIAEAREHDVMIGCDEINNRLRLVDTYDLTYAGFDGAPIRAWLHLPTGATEPLPTVISYCGYSGGRGFPFDDTVFAQAGYAQLIMDTRGQSYYQGGWAATPDPWPRAGVNHAPGWMTSGISDPREYYYRRVFTDGLRLLEAARSLPQVDNNRIAITGRSQGGGITLAVAGLAGLHDIPLVGAAPDVPFLCDFPRATTITGHAPYSEISTYLKGFRDHHDQAYATLSHFDGAILGRWATAPALFSVGLMDPSCPPSTVYAAYNWYGDKVSDKQIEIYPHNEHDGGGSYQVLASLDWLAERL